MNDPINEDLRQRLEKLLDHLPSTPAPSPTDPALDDSQLIARLLDISRPAADRLADLRHLAARHRVDRGASEAIQRLLDDPDEAIVLAAIREVPPFDLAALDRLRGMIDDGRPGIRHAAARALARRKDLSLIPRTARWLQGEDADERRAGVDVLCWLADPQDGDRLLAAAWEMPTLGLAERLSLARHLAERGDDRIADFLLELYESPGPDSDSARQILEILLKNSQNAVETSYPPDHESPTIPP